MTIALPMELESGSKSGSEHLKLIFDLCDQDKDGLITAEDFRSIGHEYFGRTQQMDALITTMDPDNSGHITFTKFQQGVETFLIEQQQIKRSRSLSSGTDDEGSTTDLSSGGEYDSIFSIDDIYPLNHLNTSYLSHGYEPPLTSTGNSAVELVVEATDGPEDRIPTPNSKSSPMSCTPDGAGSRDSPTFVARHLMRRHNQLTLPESPNQGGTPIEMAEEEVSKLSDQLLELSSKLEDLQEDKKDSEGIRNKLKRENTELKERLEEYEDQLRQTEQINEQILNESQSKIKLVEVKVRRQSEQQLMDMKSELYVTREQMERIKETETSLKSQLAIAEERVVTKEADISELEHQNAVVEEELRKTREQLRQERDKWKVETKLLKDDIQERDHQFQQLQQEYDEMQHDRRRQSITASDISQEINKLKKQLEQANRRNDELEAQFLRQGKELLENSKPQSLAAEMETASKDKVVEVLKESEEQNARLHLYIEGLLTNIMERHPEILEIPT